MIIIAGHLTIDEAAREDYLDASRDIIMAARRSHGCHDFTMAADPVEADRINIFERWDDTDAVEAFRGDGPNDDQWEAIRSADVVQYEIVASTPLT